MKLVFTVLLIGGNMAASDYRLCDICDSKCYYDSNVEYDFTEYPDTGLWNTGDWAVICRECSKTYQVIIQKRED